MRREHLRFLACPLCKSELTITEVKNEGQRVESGTLACTAGCNTFPVERGVPRVLPEGAEQIQRPETEDTSGGFSAQWKMHAYGGTTWGLSVEERIHVVLHELEWSKADLAGKIILDAGCGNGTLSCALAAYGATVVAMDLSDSVFRARENCPSDDVLFVQGNLLQPPFALHVFDAIYSCGVFHHTPSTRKCFDALVPSLRNDPEARYFVWLYAKRHPVFNLTVEHLMKLTRRMPDWALGPLCWALAPICEGILRASALLGKEFDAPRTLRDRAIQLHDLLAPAIVRYHSYEEAKHWAEKAGFGRIEETRYSVSEDAPEEVRRVLQKYETICRPGFGLLARL